jgi:predicted RNA-binding protein with PIN domain
LADAAEAASLLAARLRAAIAALETPAQPRPASPPPPLVSPPDVLTAPPPTPVPPSRPAPRPPAPSRARRQPVVLPPAVYDDSVEAAEHLVRVPSAVLVVDGYNVSLTGWPELTIAEQRRRLVDALAELAARSGADVRVVFDGSEMAMPGIVPTTARAVRVSFSPPGVEADDVVLDLVAQLPAHRPVIVASNDRRVQQGARRAGANVLTTDQLLAVLRR